MRKTPMPRQRPKEQRMPISRGLAAIALAALAACGGGSSTPVQGPTAPTPG
jgi:hypothetical protein